MSTVGAQGQMTNDWPVEKPIAPTIVGGIAIIKHPTPPNTERIRAPRGVLLASTLWK